MKITKYPQSCVLIEYKDKRILVDPGSYVYEQTDMKPEDFKDIDIVLLTHEHSDHTQPETLKIIVENNNPIIITNKPVHNILDKEGIKSEIIESGQEKDIDGIKIKGIAQKHGPLPSGNPEPDVIGFLIDDKIYHPGDTLYMEEKPYADVVFVPICGSVVMDGVEAAKFVKEIKPKLAIPIHYSSPKYPTTTDEFENQMSDSGIKIKILENKGTIEVSED
ncbi:MAG: MBL fold metallo-hydrolase [Candidatus Woesearchaeota archaeon]